MILLSLVAVDIREFPYKNELTATFDDNQALSRRQVHLDTCTISRKRNRYNQYIKVDTYIANYRICMYMCTRKA